MNKNLLALSLVLISGLSVFSNPTLAGEAETTPVPTTQETFIKAVRLINQPDGSCTFETGYIPNKVPMETKYLFAQTHVDDYEKVPHPAPRKQYVVTLKGKLRFKVTNGETFDIEPGTVLIAEDTQGKGHTWDLVDGDQWERLYIPLADGAEDHFIMAKK